MDERIFISYKRVDKERVFAIKDGIEQATGEKCWIDLDGIESNAQFVAKIVGAIDECEIFLFMRSKEHNKITNLETDWTIREVNYALEEHKNIVIVNLDNTPMPKWFKFMFPNKQEIDATDPDKLTHLNNDLCEWLGVTIGTNPQPIQVETPTGFTPNQPTIVQSPANMEQIMREALPEGEFQVGDLMYKASKNSDGVTVCGLVDQETREIEIPAQIQYGKYTYDVLAIDNMAFKKCGSLTSIVIYEGLTHVGRAAFMGCSKLISVIIPNSVTSIGKWAFEDCARLTSIVIPDSVTTIEDFVFNRCTRLESIVVGAGNKTYDSRENCNAIIKTTTNTLVVGCKNTIIPNTITTIGWWAFSNTLMTSIVIPNSVTSIEESAFYGCTALVSVTILDGVKTIDEGAFRECKALTSVIIGNGVTSIEKEAFDGCSALKFVIMPKSLADIVKDSFPINTIFRQMPSKETYIQDVQQWIDQVGLRESNTEDECVHQLIDAICNLASTGSFFDRTRSGAISIDFPSLDPTNSDEANIQECRRYMTDLRKFPTNKQISVLLDGFKTQLDDKIRALLQEIGGVYNALKFVELFKSYCEAFKTTMGSEIESLTNQRAEREDEFYNKTFNNYISAKYSAWHPFHKQKNRWLLEELVGFPAYEILKFSYEIKRREVASNIYDTLIAQAEAFSKQLSH